MMRRVRILVEYDGTGYSGWQRQSNAVSVQQVLEEASFARRHVEMLARSLKENAS